MTDVPSGRSFSGGLRAAPPWESAICNRLSPRSPTRSKVRYSMPAAARAMRTVLRGARTCGLRSRFCARSHRASQGQGRGQGPRRLLPGHGCTGFRPVAAAVRQRDRLRPVSRARRSRSPRMSMPWPGARARRPPVAAVLQRTGAARAGPRRISRADLVTLSPTAGRSNHWTKCGWKRLRTCRSAHSRPVALTPIDCWPAACLRRRRKCRDLRMGNRRWASTQPQIDEPRRNGRTPKGGVSLLAWASFKCRRFYVIPLPATISELEIRRVTLLVNCCSCSSICPCPFVNRRQTLQLGVDFGERVSWWGRRGCAARLLQSAVRGAKGLEGRHLLLVFSHAARSYRSA